MFSVPNVEDDQSQNHHQNCINSILARRSIGLQVKQKQKVDSLWTDCMKLSAKLNVFKINGGRPTSNTELRRD